MTRRVVVRVDILEAEQRAHAETIRQHETTIDELIDVLGLRDEYPDETRAIYRPWGPGGYFYERTTTYGRGRFLADIHAAHEASTGAEALARIKSALGKK